MEKPVWPFKKAALTDEDMYHLTDAQRITLHNYISASFGGGKFMYCDSCGEYVTPKKIKHWDEDGHVYCC